MSQERRTKILAAPYSAGGPNASSRFPGWPPWNPVYPEVTNTIPLATVAPAEPMEPPLPVTPFTVVTSCVVSYCQIILPSFVA